MPNAPVQATAEGLPTRRRLLAGLAVTALAAAVPLALRPVAAMDMPEDLADYMVERWPKLSDADRTLVAENWREMSEAAKGIVRYWCGLPDDRKLSVLEAMQS